MQRTQPVIAGILIITLISIIALNFWHKTRISTLSLARTRSFNAKLNASWELYDAELEYESANKPLLDTIGLVCAVTSTGIKTAEQHPFIRSLAPSFCTTASSNFIYRFYLSFDYSDKYFSKGKLRDRFTRAVLRVVRLRCPWQKVS